MNNLFLPEQEALQRSEFMLATIATADSAAGTVTMTLDGMTSAMQKSYKTLSGAWPLAAGDRVVVMKMSGTYVVLGKIGSASSPSDILPIANGGTGQSAVETETTLANIMAAGTNVTISSVSFAKWGKIAMLAGQFTRTTAQSLDSGFVTIGTLVEGKRPAFTGMFAFTDYGLGTGAVWYTGGIWAYGKYTANTSQRFGAIYLLP